MNTTTDNKKTQGDNLLIGADFDGTITDGFIPPKDAVIITGRHKDRETDTRRFLAGIQRSNLPIYFMPDNIQHDIKTIAEWKGKMIKKLGVTKFYENEEAQISILKSTNPALEIVHWQEKKKDTTKYVLFTSEGTGIPIAHHLQMEGYEVYIGQAESFKELGIESTPEEDKKLTLSQDLYKGILKKYPAQKLLSVLSKVKNKDDYFVICDLNSLYKYGEALLKLGFKRGIFPTKADFDFEKGREEAMTFVEKNYPDVKIIPFQKIKTVEDAKKAVEESEVPLVIQSEGDFVSTIVPPDDLEKNKTEILSALEKFKADYSKGEIILKEKLVKPVEITPEMVFWNGTPVFTDIDIETKNIGDGENNGNQVGCGSNLIVKTEIDEKINKISFPPVVYEMAKKHTGIFVWDISLYFTEKGIYFGEFCSNRFGYDAVLTEMSMSEGSGAFFEAIEAGKNPLKHKFGTAVRVFNLNKQKDTEITIEDFKNTWVYETKLDKDRWFSLGVYWDLAVATSSADDIEEAVKKMYEIADGLSFKEKYYRKDFLNEYPTSIMHRFNETNHKYFEVPDYIKSDEVSTMSKQLKDLSDKIDVGIDGLKTLTDARKNTDLMKSKMKDKIKSMLKI